MPRCKHEKAYWFYTGGFRAAWCRICGSFKAPGGRWYKPKWLRARAKSAAARRKAS